MPSIDARLARLERRARRPREPSPSDFDHAAYQAAWDRYTVAGLGDALMASMLLTFGRYEAAGWVPEEAAPATTEEIELDRALAEALAGYEADPDGYRPPTWPARYRAHGRPGDPDAAA